MKCMVAFETQRETARARAHTSSMSHYANRKWHIVAARARRPQGINLGARVRVRLERAHSLSYVRQDK